MRLSGWKSDKVRHRIATRDQLASLFRGLSERVEAGIVLDVTAKRWQAPKTRPQEDRFHAMIRDVVKSGLEWAGQERTFDEWKVLIKSAVAYAEGQPYDVVRGMEGEVVSLSGSCSHWTKRDYMNAIEYLYAFGEQNGVRFTEQVEDYNGRSSEGAAPQDHP